MFALMVTVSSASLGALPADCPIVEARVHPHVWQLLGDRGESVKVWVKFRDKNIAGDAERQAALAELEQSYNPKAVERRKLRRMSPGLFDERDLPVAERYIASVAATGARVHVASKWINAVSAGVNRVQLDAIRTLPFVAGIEPVRRGVRTDVVPAKPVRQVLPGGAELGGGFYGGAEDQLAQIGVIDMHDDGYTGAGVVIGVLDTGFHRTHNAYNEAGHVIDVIAEHDFVDDDGNVQIEGGDPPDQHAHGTLVLATIGGYRPNEMIGGAYSASFILAKTEDTTQEVQAEEDDYVAGLEFIEANGADMATSSLGYIDWYTQADLDGLTATTTIAVNAATDNGLICCTSAGNEGNDVDDPSLIAPADAFKVISCGAVDINGDVPSFSSKGPTADGRVKPEVLARGVSTFSIAFWNNTDYWAYDGTSLSAPLVASAVALLIQAHPDWTVNHIRTALIETADYYVANGTHDPAFIRGYGIIDVHAASQMHLGGGDFDENGAVNLADYQGFQRCYSGAGNAHPEGLECRVADFDGDGDVDDADTADFVAAM